LAKRNAGGSPLKRLMPLTQVGLPLDYAHPEPSHRLRFRHRGRVLPLSSGAAFQPDRGQLRHEIRS
jgi:hypothetical protein